MTHRWFALMLLGCAASACTPDGLSTSTAKPSASPPVAAAQDMWNSLASTPLFAVRSLPSSGCPTGPASVRSGVEPIVGSNPAAPELKVGQPAPVLWRVAGGYLGPILLRGRQYDGQAPVYFAAFGSTPSGTTKPTPDGPVLKTVPTSTGPLQLYGGMRLTAAKGAESWWMYAYAETPGCFFYQQDGSNYDGISIFEVAA